MRASWLNPRLPPSPITRQRNWSAVTRTRSLPRSATSASVSCEALYVGAYPAVPQQVHRRSQDRLHQLIGGQHLGVDAQCGPCLRRHRNRSARPRIHTPARGKQRTVVVRPRRPRQRRQPGAFRERGLRVRVGIQENVPMVERGD